MQKTKKNSRLTKINFILCLVIALYFVLWYFVKPIPEAEADKVPQKEIQIVYITVEPELLLTQEIIEEKIIVPEVVVPIEPAIIKTISPTSGGSREFIITAYDNSIESQGKWVNQTATGFNLKGHTLSSAKCIAVDPKVIPLNSKVELTFDDSYKHLNGVYIARDTGGAIKGKKIDLFMGDGVAKSEVMAFGKRKVQIRILD